jgi:hypothetical protein
MYQDWRRLIAMPPASPPRESYRAGSRQRRPGLMLNTSLGRGANIMDIVSDRLSNFDK